MTPVLLLGLVLSTLYGAAFHFWRGGKAGRLLLYLVLSCVGFWSGHLVAGYFDWTFDSLGQLHLGTATVVSFIFIIAGYWLSLVQVERRQGNP